MLLLKEFQICPHGKICPYTRDEGPFDLICSGLDAERPTKFECRLVKEDGKIEFLACTISEKCE